MMKELMYLNKKQIQKHLIAWVLLSIYIGIVTNFMGTWPATIIGQGLGIINYMFVFYTLSLYVFPKYWKSKRAILLLWAILILLLYFIFGHLISIRIIPALGGWTYYQKESLFQFLKQTFYFFVIAASAGIASFFSRYGLYKLKLQAEKEKILLIKEISFIKNQFNPKTTFDFLNYCVHSIQPYSPETAASMVLFSDMLNYTLQTRPNEEVLLKDEIAYIENFICIQKLLSSKVYVNFKYFSNTGDNKIYPRILITFVENAFKHGLSNNSEHPIEITLMLENDKIAFSICNIVNPNKKMASSHTGLENVKQILNLHYADNYGLSIKEEGEKFYVGLTLVIER